MKGPDQLEQAVADAATAVCFLRGGGDGCVFASKPAASVAGKPPLYRETTIFPSSCQPPTARASPKSNRLLPHKCVEHTRPHPHVCKHPPPTHTHLRPRMETHPHPHMRTHTHTNSATEAEAAGAEAEAAEAEVAAVAAEAPRAGTETAKTVTAAASGVASLQGSTVGEQKVGSEADVDEGAEQVCAVVVLLPIPLSSPALFCALSLDLLAQACGCARLS